MNILVLFVYSLGDWTSNGTDIDPGVVVTSLRNGYTRRKLRLQTKKWKKGICETQNRFGNQFKASIIVSLKNVIEKAKSKTLNVKKNLNKKHHRQH